MATIVRRRANKIESLKDKEGNWVTDKMGLRNTTIRYFSNLFGMDEGSQIPEEWPNLFNSADSCKDITEEVTLEDVKRAIFFLGPLKAPGEDGLPAIFYQRAWELSKVDHYQFVAHCFSTASLPNGLNSTLIALVPKCANPSAMTDMRPISLCNTVYKVIIKILVSKIKHLLPSIVSPTQASFVPGRNISDNIFIL